MTLRRLSYLSNVLVPIVATISLSASGQTTAQGPEICICTQPDAIDKATNQILVYTYINGKKTECMPKPKLIALYYAETGTTKGDPETQRKIRAVDSSKAANSVLTSKNLQGTNLKTKDMKGVDLSDANLQDADLESADLRGANLRNADLRKANLRYAYLKGADLRGANVTGASLEGAYLNDADMRGILGFSIDNVRAVRTLYEAKLDTTFREEIAYCCGDKLKQASWYWHNNEWADWRAEKGGKKNPERPAQAPRYPDLQ